MGQKVLIIGVDEAYHDYVTAEMGTLGIGSDTVATVEEATIYLNECWVDVVFLSDENLDEKLAETIQILKSTKASPVILITGNGMADKVELAIKSGSSAYLSHYDFLGAFKRQLNMIWKGRSVGKLSKKFISDTSLNLSYEKPRILVVDDSSLLRNLTKKMLPEENYEVLTAKDGKDCLEKLAYFDPDIVLSDIVMPEMNGIELCKAIKISEEYKHIPVLLMSTESELGRKINGFSVGAADYLIKPFEEEELRARLTTHFLQKKLIENLKLENSKRQSAEENLQKYSNELEDTVSERTKELKISNKLLQTEINDRKQIQSELEKNQKKYRDLIETVNEWIWEVSIHNIITYSSPKVFEVLGYQPEEVVGQNLSVVMSHEEAERLKIVVMANKENPQKLQSYEHICKHQNNDLVNIESSIVSFFDENNKIIGYRGVSRDITFMKKSKIETARLERQLLHSEKMAAIGQLAAGVAHEINNPIGFVNSNLYTLSEYVQDIKEFLQKCRYLFTRLNCLALNENDTEMLSDINQYSQDIDMDFIVSDSSELINDCLEGIERVKTIVISLKDFAHPGDHKKNYFNINKSIDSTLAIVWNELKYKAKIVKNYGDIPEVYCNITELNQVFMNLLVNAGHAIEKEGTITITTNCVDDGKIEIKISDTGQGIPDEIKTKIFDPFFTTKKVGEGTGLGLNLSYNIVLNHGGTIAVESEVAKGSTFIVTIAVDNYEERTDA